MFDSFKQWLEARWQLNRNHTLVAQLLKHGVSLSQPRTIDCHFWLRTELQAKALAQKLQARGFEILRTNAASGESGLWNLEASISQSPNHTAKVSFIREMVRLAQECGGTYDGWGTQV